MGCILSTDPNFTVSNVIDIPVIPGWDGIALSTKNVVVEIELKPTWTGTKTSFEALTHAITE